MKVSKNQKTKFNFILIGRSGSGKGTQAKLLKKHFPGMLHVVSGDLFRQLGRKRTLVSQRIKEVINKGGLPFTQLATALWLNFIANHLKLDQGLICDGFPRRRDEAKDLDKFLHFLKQGRRNFVFLIDVSEKEATRRLLKRKRTDDNQQAIRKRMLYFKQSVLPTIDYYRRNKCLVTINGEQSVVGVFNDILKAINE